MIYYVYVDWTAESVPRPFYVGKGSGRRVLRQRRNWQHRKNRLKFGYNRVQVFFSENESEVLAREIALIAELHTFVDDQNYNGIGCNFTAGGEGGAHPSAQSRRLIGESNRRRKGEKRSEPACQRIRAGIQESLERRGKYHLSDHHKRQIAKGLIGRAVSAATREKLAIAARRQHQNPEINKRRAESLARTNATIEVRLRRSRAAKRREQAKRS